MMWFLYSFLVYDAMKGNRKLLCDVIESEKTRSVANIEFCFCFFLHFSPLVRFKYKSSPKLSNINEGMWFNASWFWIWLCYFFPLRLSSIYCGYMVFFLGKETQCGIKWKDIFLCKFSFSIYEFFFPRINGSNHSQTKKIVLELVFGSVIEIETNQTKKILDILEFNHSTPEQMWGFISFFYIFCTMEIDFRFSHCNLKFAEKKNLILYPVLKIQGLEWRFSIIESVRVVCVLVGYIRNEFPINKTIDPGSK